MRWTQDNPTEVGPIPVIEETPLASTKDSHVLKLALLWNERKFLVKIALWGLVCSALLSFLLPVRFEATAHLMPPDSGGSEGLAILSALSDKAGALGGVAGNLLGVKSSSDLMVGILSSQTLQDRLIERYDLKKVYKLSYQEDLRTKLADNTAISVDRKNGIISVTVTDHDPSRAAAMANSYVDELNVLSAELSTSSARREREFLERRLSQVSEDLERAEKDFSEFASKNATLNIQEQGKAMVEAAADLQGRIITAQAQLDGLRAIYTDTSLRVRALKAEIASLQQEIEKMGGKPGTQPPGDASGQLYPSIRQLPLLGVTYADLYRRAKVQEAVFETLTKQYELAKVQEAKEIPSVKVLDRAGLPQKKSFPPRTFITLMGTAFAFLFGVVWTLAAAKWAAIDPESPGKVLAANVWNTIIEPLKSRFSDGSQWTRKMKTRIRSQVNSPDNQSET